MHCYLFSLRNNYSKFLIVLIPIPSLVVIMGLVNIDIHPFMFANATSVINLSPIIQIHSGLIGLNDI